MKEKDVLQKLERRRARLGVRAEIIGGLETGKKKGKGGQAKRE